MAIIKCPECSRKISDQSRSCPKCGRPLNNAGSAFDRFSAPDAGTYNGSMMVSSKSRLIYAGKSKSGILLIAITFTGIFIIGIPLLILISILWCLVDFIMILCGTFTDSERLALKEWV